MRKAVFQYGPAPKSFALCRLMAQMRSATVSAFASLLG
jgi:hypothetical protein